MLKGNVFITGGSGFLGRGILQRACDENWDCNFTVFSRDEVKHSRIRRMFPNVKTIRGDVAGDLDYLMAAMTGHNIVIHAAATKVIPIAEHNAIQTVQDNIGGSLNVALAACQVGVKQVLGISTDKACNPINTYGMTKAILERIFFEAQAWNYDTNFHLVRYGNVLDSTASVLTLWQQQIEDMGRLTMTNPKMTRFWLNINQAVDLVLLALQQTPGTIAIPLLKSLKMADMADYVYPKSAWEITGLRPGEKIHEQLVSKEEWPFVRKIDDDHVSLYPSTVDILDSGWQLVEDVKYGYDSLNAEKMTKDEFLRMVGND